MAVAGGREPGREQREKNEWENDINLCQIKMYKNKISSNIKLVSQNKIFTLPSLKLGMHWGTWWAECRV